MPQLLYHHLASHHLHYTAINEVYLSRAARAFGLSIIGIFIPIYLYNLGYGLASIAAFFIIANFVRLLVTPLAAYLLSRFGAKHLMAFGQLWAIIFVALLLFAERNTGLLVLTALVWGIDLGIFWLAHHHNLSYVRTLGRTSRQIGVVFMLFSIAHALGPLVGGVVATQFGIQYTLWLAIGFLLAASYVFLRTPGDAPPVQFTWRDAFRGWKHMRPHMTANGANGFQGEAALNMWPLFIFLFLGTYQMVGVAVSASLMVSLIIIYLVSRRGDQGRNWQQLRTGSKSSALVHLVRPFVQTLGAAASVNVIHEIASHLYKIPFLSYYYEHASNSADRLGYILKLEMAVCLGSIASWAMLLGLGTLLPIQRAVVCSFAFASVAALFITRIARPLPATAQSNSL